MSDPKRYHQQFPFHQHLQDDDNFWESIEDLKELGYTEDQIWSVCEDTDEEGNCYYVTGPSFHVANKIGYFATTERHDGLTYYVEKAGWD